mgnify:CR=1 FL=1
MNYNGLIVIVIQFKTNLSYILHISDFIFIKIEQKLNQRIKSKILLILSECYKSQDQGVLLLNLIKYDISASCLSELIVDDCSWNGCKEEHVEKDEDYVEDIIWLEILNS